MMLLSCAALTCGDAASKLLTETYPVGQIIFTRSVLIVFMVLAACALRGDLSELVPVDIRGQLTRAAWFAAATFCFVWSIKLLPLPVVSAIMFASPIMLTALAGPLLGEFIGWRRWFAVVLGFLGVLFILDPAGGGWGLIVLVPLLGAFMAAMRDLSTRRVTRAETTVSVLVISLTVTAVPALATLPFGWALPSPGDAMLFALVGVTQGAAFYMQVGAFRLAEASLIAPYKYSIIIWSTLLGYLIWGDVPSMATVAGASLVIAAGIFIFRREARRPEPVL